MNLEIIPYTKAWEEKWDRFVLEESVSGTFLQTRRFLNYHPEGRFTDASLLVMQGSNIAAVIPGCVAEEEGGKCFFSHRGSTFGGILPGRGRYNITTLNELFPLFHAYLQQEGFESVYIRNTSDVFARESQELMDYYLYYHGYQAALELSLYMDCARVAENIVQTWSSGRRRDYRYAERNGLTFRRMAGDAELAAFYTMLTASLARHGVKPVHTLAELRDFRDVRFPEWVDFYGVYLGEKMIAGTMLFYFEKRVLHTQYLAQDADCSHLFPMNFLIYHLIRLAKEGGYEKFSFGISTEDRGKTLNTGLAVFKEGFGAQYCSNRSWFRAL